MVRLLGSHVSRRQRDGNKEEQHGKTVRKDLEHDLLFP